ncbi:hypothetical protein VE00_09804 [Pseudogymnoascus sp. WSF 3629]|nr:hypothetical protein VE00_09804 [Pseudogymnoascus sp. WSF 3629]
MVNVGSNHGSRIKLSPDLETIKAGRRGDGASDLVDRHRRTQDWKFPSITPSASADINIYQFPTSYLAKSSADINIYRFPTSYEPPSLAMTPESNYYAALVDHPMELIGHGVEGSSALSQQTKGRFSIADSLIDLDTGLPDSITELSRPSTGSSNIGSPTGGSHFELERHAWLCQPDHPMELVGHGIQGSSALSEQAKDRFSIADSLIDLDMGLPDSITELSRPSTGSSDIGSPTDEQKTSGSHFELESSDTEAKTMHSFRNEAVNYQASVNFDSEYTSIPPSQGASQRLSLRPPDQVYTMAHFPDIPAPPSLAAMSGTASDSEMLSEMSRLLSSLTEQLGAFYDVYMSMGKAWFFDTFDYTRWSINGNHNTVAQPVDAPSWRLTR